MSGIVIKQIAIDGHAVFALTESGNLYRLIPHPKKPYQFQWAAIPVADDILTADEVVVLAAMMEKREEKKPEGSPS